MEQLSGIIGTLGILALGIGVLFTAPMSYLLFVSAYRQMEGRPKGRSRSESAARA